MDSVTFSIIVPTRKRIGRLQSLLDSVVATAHQLSALEIVLVVDRDDRESTEFEDPRVRLNRVLVDPGLRMGALNMAGYRAASGRYLMLLNDDVVLRTEGWDQQVLGAFRSYPDGMVLVHVNDLLFRETLCIFPFVAREFCELTGGICEEGYRRYRIDDHIHNIFDLLSLLGHDRRIFLKDVIFEHTNLEKDADGVVQYVPDPAIHAEDTELFGSLLADRKRIALEAMNRIENRMDAERFAMWAKRLEPVTDSVAIRDPRHARYFSIDRLPRVTIGVVSADCRSIHARKCLDLIKACTANYDLILIDNSGDSNFNHSREMNRLLSICRTDYLVLMDDDVHVQPRWLEGMLRALTPEVGVVTPLHLSRRGDLSYAGIVMQPDDSGHHTHIVEAPSEPRRIQTLCSAVMLIDRRKCGYIRLDERYSKYFLDIDYGLRVWEEGLQVVCSPYSLVTHLAGATLEQGGSRGVVLFEEQRQRYVESWVRSGRIGALRAGIWRTIPEICWLAERSQEIDRLIERGERSERAKFMREAEQLVQSLSAYPALKEYIATKALAGLGDQQARAENPDNGHLAFLLGLCRQPVLFEAGFLGMNIVLHNFTYYALPQGEGAFSYERMQQNGYTRSYEAASAEAIKSLILQWRKAPPHPHVVADRPAASRAIRAEV